MQGLSGERNADRFGDAAQIADSVQAAEQRVSVGGARLPLQLRHVVGPDHAAESDHGDQLVRFGKTPRRLLVIVVDVAINDLADADLLGQTQVPIAERVEDEPEFHIAYQSTKKVSTQPRANMAIACVWFTTE